ncbi:MAG TPA: TnsA endonuclease N-terminal domain-containing protein, partial [Longimicrobium sp.]
FGEGEGADYKPWLTVRSFGSRGIARRILGRTVDRVHHVFSNLERDCFVLLDWNDAVTDIREQYPLHPIEETLSIADELSYGHPRAQRKRKGEWVTEPVVMTSDFRVTLCGEADPPEVVISVKELQELNDVHTLEKLEVERCYWERRGVPWVIVTERELPRALVDNLSFLAAHRAAEGHAVPAPRMREALAVVAAELEAAVSEPTASVCSGCDSRLGLAPGACLALVWHALATKIWSTDLTFVLNPGRPLALDFGTAPARARRWA